MSATPTQLISNVQDLAALLSNWHQAKVDMLNHMMNIPEGTEMQVDGEDPLILTGSALAGFKAGLTVAMSELGEFPLEFEYEPNEPQTPH